MRLAAGVSLRQTEISLLMLPLPLGEGQGEGIAEQCKNSSPYFLAVRIREEGARGGLSHKPSPNPSPKGRGNFKKINLFRSSLKFVEQRAFRYSGTPKTTKSDCSEVMR